MRQSRRKIVALITKPPVFDKGTNLRNTNGGQIANILLKFHGSNYFL